MSPQSLTAAGSRGRVEPAHKLQGEAASGLDQAHSELTKLG